MMVIRLLERENSDLLSDGSNGGCISSGVVVVGGRRRRRCRDERTDGRRELYRKCSLRLPKPRLPWPSTSESIAPSWFDVVMQRLRFLLFLLRSLGYRYISSDCVYHILIELERHHYRMAAAASSSSSPHLMHKHDERSREKRGSCQIC